MHNICMTYEQFHSFVALTPTCGAGISVLIPVALPVSTELGSPRDLTTRDVTDTSFLVSWVPAPGNVRQYRIKWKSLYGEEAGEKTIPGDNTAVVLDGLTPETRYQVSVSAVYGHGEGQPLKGEETTDSKSHIISCFCSFAFISERYCLKMKEV